MTRIQLSDHFTYSKLFKFTLPSVAMMIFTSIYGVVDGFFVSNYVGKTPFAAVNFIFPFIMIMGAVGFMFGAGGGALVAKTLGEGERELANKYFSLFVYSTIIFGIIASVLGFIYIRPIASWLGAEGDMLEYCVIYGRINLVTLVPLMLQMEFQNFFITAEKPQLGFAMTVSAGVTNIVLDFVLVGILHFGIVGAAAATSISQLMGGLFPLFYFTRKNNSLLRLTKTRFYGKAFLKACTNGSSELMTNISMSLVNMLYNFQLMKYAGENGVAAYGVLMYVNFIFISTFIGYSIGTAPVISYHYGAENRNELHSILKKSAVIIGTLSVAMTILAIVLARPMAQIYVGYDAELFELTVRGFFVYSFSFLFSGFCIYGSSFFTSLNNGLVSALISFLRTLLFQVAAVMLLPIIWEMDGIWLSVVVSELASFFVTLMFIFGMKNKYGY